MRPKVLRKVYPGIGTLHNNSDLVDPRDLNGGKNCCCGSDGSAGLMSADAAPLCTSGLGIDDE